MALKPPPPASSSSSSSPLRHYRHRRYHLPILLLLISCSVVSVTPQAAAAAASADEQDDAAVVALGLVPWPYNVTYPVIFAHHDDDDRDDDSAAAAPTATRSITLTPSSRILFSGPGLAGAAGVLAEELLAVHGLKLVTAPAGGSQPPPQPGDVLLRLTPARSPPPPPAPPAPPPVPVPPAPVCTQRPATKLNNTLYADPNGPRTAADADACCEMCGRTAGCESWSFQIDAQFPLTLRSCKWAHLTYCCWMHSKAGNANPVHDPSFTSGVLPAAPKMPATLPPVTTPGWPSTSYTLGADARSRIIEINATTEDGVLAGTSTLLQASNNKGLDGGDGAVASVTVPAIHIVDRPFRSWRGIQLDLHGTPYHSIPMLKKFVVLARYYKVNIITFNIGPSLWLSPAMESSSLMNASWKAGKNSAKGCYQSRCMFYSAADITELVTFAAKRGVRFVPSTGCMPGVSEMVKTLNGSMLPPNVGYRFHDWMDEVDHQGPSTYSGSQTGPDAARFWKFIGVAVERVYRLFAAGWPDGILPTWHVGAVEGEGGMSGLMLRRFYDAVQAAAVSVHGPRTPVVTVGSYNGIDAQDAAIKDITANLVTHWYTENYSRSSLKEYLQAGWQVVDISWVPLYIAGDHFSPDTVFSLFNIFRASARQQCDPPSNEQYWVPGREAQTIGAIMSTWTAKQPDEIGQVRMKLGAFAEHAWNYRPWPYPKSGGAGSWAAFEPRAAAADRVLDKLIGSLIRNYACDEATLQCKKMPTFANGTSFVNGTDWQSNCGAQHNKECCGKPCPGPAPGIVYGGRLFVTRGGPSTNMSLHGLSGLAAADALCASQAPPDSGLPATHYKALLADEPDSTACSGQPCRRATITPGRGDGALDWVIAPNAAYYLLDNTTMVTVSNSTRMLGVANHSKVGGGNQISPFGHGWITTANATCKSSVSQ
jgi:hypothetical protein